MSMRPLNTGTSVTDADVSFPAPIYRDTVLAQVFADAKKYFLAPLLEIEYAHTLMLARQGLMPATGGRAVFPGA